MNEPLNSQPTATGGENIPTTGEAGNPTPESGEKTFTQAQLDGIIKERLAKERERAAADVAQREQELAKREFSYQAKELLTARKLPLEVLDALNAPDMDTLQKSLAIIEQHLNTNNPNKLVLPGGNGNMPTMPDAVRTAMGLKR